MHHRRMSYVIASLLGVAIGSLSGLLLATIVRPEVAQTLHDRILWWRERAEERIVENWAQRQAKVFDQRVCGES